MFVTFEGIEGSGKSTQIRHMARYLEALGHNCLITREPGGTRIGADIRAILLDPENSELDPVAELFLYAADRRQHVQEFIRPALAEGKTVICDRFHDSTVVYQGVSRALDRDLVKQCNDRILEDLQPDITFLLDLAPEVGLRRAWQEFNQGGRQRRETRFEAEALDFHHKVRGGYLDLARKEPARFVVVDAAGDENTVRKAVLAALEAKLKTALYS
ncbi:MAG: dTMP kinase [Desulfosalsimonadaceae bacterium]